MQKKPTHFTSDSTSRSKGLKLEPETDRDFSYDVIPIWDLCE